MKPGETTAPKAVLNVTQLTNMLVDESVTIGTSAAAPDIFVNAPFSWTSGNGLTLQAIGNIVGNARLQARVGYFGICINPDGGSWLCSNNATALANEVSVDQDPLNLIWLASQFKDMVVFPYLLIIAIILSILSSMAVR